MEQLKGHETGRTTSVERAPTRRTADILVDILAEHGVEVVFGLPGGPIGPVLDALIDRPQIRAITTRHEAGAMFAAAGYAQSTGRLGVAIVTSGPGVLNAMTGLASANCDGLPVLVLVGEVARQDYGKGAIQDGSGYALNIVGMAKHITKFASEAFNPNSAPALLRKAIATALSGRRGPVLITLPMDTTNTTIVVPEISVQASSTFSIPRSAIDTSIEALGTSQRTVLLVGSGVRCGAGPERLVEFAERAQCAVMTTPKGKGIFPESHPLSLGVFGMGGHASTSDFLSSGVDTMLAVGTSLGDLTTNGWSSLLKPRRSFIHVDIDSQQIGRNYPATLGVVAPAEEYFAAMLERLPQRPPRDYGGIRHHADAKTMRVGSEGRIALPRALWEIQQVFGSDTIYTVDAGEHFCFATHYLHIDRPDSFFQMMGLGAMGSSIGAAIGAKMAHPERDVVAICGDGCFAMNAFELATAVAEQIPIVVFVVNDQRLGMVEIGDTALYGRTPRYPTTPVNIAKVATALGAQSYTVRQPNEIPQIEALRRQDRRPIVVELVIDRSITLPKKSRFEKFEAPKKASLRLVN